MSEPFRMSVAVVGVVTGLASGLAQILGLRWDAPAVLLGLNGFWLVVALMCGATAVLCAARPRRSPMTALAVFVGWTIGVIGWVVSLLVQNSSNSFWPLGLAVNTLVGLGAVLLGIGVGAAAGLLVAKTRSDEGWSV